MDNHKPNYVHIEADKELEEIPKRSAFWFDSKKRDEDSYSGFFDRVTLFFTFCLTLISFIIFWPIISQISFEEAFLTPLVPFILNLFGNFNLDANYSVRILFIVAFILSTVGLYLLVRELARRQVTPILAAVLYLIPPIPIIALALAKNDFLELGIEGAKSFFMIMYGDTSHFLALSLVPFAMLFFFKFLKEGTKKDLFVVVFICTLVLLINRSQSFYLGIILLISTTGEAILGLARIKIFRFLQVLIFSIALSAFWYVSNFWIEGYKVFGENAFANLELLFPLPFIIGILSLLFSFVFFAKREDRQLIFVTFSTFIVFFSIILVWFLHGRSLMPYPHRLLPNLIMFGAIIVALTLSSVVDKLKIVEKIGFSKWSVGAKALGALVFGVGSFVFLTLVAYFVSPIIILALAGPGGVITKIKENVLADRAETIRLAGGNFGLVSQNEHEWKLLLGLTISILAVLCLLFLLLFKRSSKKN